jgi:cysteine-rich repeat protein
MAYDAARGRVVLFGGHDGALDGETWEYDGVTATWTLVTPSGSSPSARGSHAMAYDAARNRVILFGGSDFPLDGETWEYDGATATWTQVTPSGSSPSPRYQHAMAYDASRGRVVLFGGSDAGGLDGETWEYDGATATWTQVTPTGSSPSPRESHAMAYDAVRGRVVLFGGNDNALDGETWEYDGATATWTQITPIGSTPSPRKYHAMAYDAARGRAVLFSGNDGDYDGETWTFQYRAGGMNEACHLGLDGDKDGRVGCADPDCWAYCTPTCPPRSTPGWPSDCSTAAPHCGDGVCNAYLESPRLCPADCGAPTPVCGDFLCDAGETAATCPGDCARCGDGTRQANEQCDDGNHLAGDGCSPGCQLE